MDSDDLTGSPVPRPRARVLVIDDGTNYADAVAEHLDEFELVSPGESAVALGSGPRALAYLERGAGNVDVILLDLHFDIDEGELLPLEPPTSLKRTKRFQGVAILRELRKRHPELPVVLMTAVEDLSLVDVDGELAAQSLTYFLDRDDLQTLRIRINAALQERTDWVEDSSLLWGADRRIQGVRRRLAVLARSSMPVILEGETGTGKSYLAERYIHQNSGRSGPFVTADLAAIPRDLVPSYLFGATKGAYTGSVADRKGVFELAHGGTLFLDEVQNIPLEIQRQLLTVLQERRVRPLGGAKELPVDVKVVAASNVPLDAAVANGTFRQDLYMRLGPATRVVLPPLRERSKDLPFLVRQLVPRAATDPDVASLRELVGEAAGVGKDAPVRWVVGREPEVEGAMLTLVCPEPVWRQILQHSWPGNFRELSTVIHNIVVFTFVGAADALRSGLSLNTPRLQVDPGLVGELLSSVPLAAGGPPGRGNSMTVVVEPGSSLNAVAVEVERQYFRHLFLATGGEFERMAERLLGDADKARAVRLRFNQIGLKARELRRA